MRKLGKKRQKIEKLNYFRNFSSDKVTNRKKCTKLAKEMLSIRAEPEIVGLSPQN